MNTAEDLIPKVHDKLPRKKMIKTEYEDDDVVCRKYTPFVDTTKYPFVTDEIHPKHIFDKELIPLLPEVGHTTGNQSDD